MSDPLHSRDALLEAVHHCLDERCPPLADARVRSLLEEAPERLPEVLALLEGVQAVEEPRTTQSPARLARRTRAAAAIVALVVVGAGLTAWWLQHRPVTKPKVEPSRLEAPSADSPRDEMASPAPQPEDLGRVLTWSAEVVREREGEREIISRRAGRLERRVVQAPVTTSGGPSGWVEARVVVAMERRLSK